VSRVLERDLDAMVAQATVDAYGEDEELAGFHAVLTDRLVLPFTTRGLGVNVSALTAGILTTSTSFLP